jgi:hypothetical protein
MPMPIRNSQFLITNWLPPLATQQAIVAEIEAEQALVAANRELISRFEKKIQTTLARIWGEETSATTKVVPLPEELMAVAETPTPYRCKIRFRP